MGPGRAEREELNRLWRARGFSSRATFAFTQLGLRNYEEIARVDMKTFTALPYVGRRTAVEIERKLAEWKRSRMMDGQKSRRVAANVEA